jgi:hypothetical protein
MLIDFAIGLGPGINDPLPIESEDVFLLLTIKELGSDASTVFCFIK